jgi:hypothetical protein
MSFGKKSPLFAPVTEAMLPAVYEAYPEVSPNMIRRIFGIMTDRLSTEALLFAALIDMIDRFRRGIREDEPTYGHFGAGTKLSAVRKNGSGKMQTKIMELLHDVVVESWMAMGNMRRLQAYLNGEGMALVSLHSCYMLVIGAADVDAFYEACACDQARRTELDWTGITVKDAPLAELLAETEYTEAEADTAHRMFTTTKAMLASGGVRAGRSLTCAICH